MPQQCSNILTARKKRNNDDTDKFTLTPQTRGLETTRTNSSQSTAPESETLTLKSSFQNHPSKRQKTSNLDRFVIKTTQQHDIHLKVAEFFYSCNIPFATVDIPCFLKMVSGLRSGYVPPNRKQLSDSLLDEVYDIYEKKMVKILLEESNRPITLMLDGWSSCKNDPILASSIHTGKSSMLLSSKDCCSDKKKMLSITCRSQKKI